MDGEKCRGVIVLGVTEHIPSINVDLAHVDPAYPQAWVLLLTALRRHASEQGVEAVTFTCHLGNEEMARCVDLVGAQPVSTTYSLAIPAKAAS